MERSCICEGNLRDIIAEYEPKFGTVYNTERGTYKLIGIAICKDDYYYLLQSTHDYMYPRSLWQFLRILESISLKKASSVS